MNIYAKKEKKSEKFNGKDDDDLHDMQGNERKSEGKCTKLATDGASTGRNLIN